MCHARAFILFRLGTPLREIAARCDYRTIADAQRGIACYEAYRRDQPRPIVAIDLDRLLRNGTSCARVATIHRLDVATVVAYSRREYAMIDGWVRQGHAIAHLDAHPATIMRYCDDGLLVHGIANGERWIKVM